MEFTSSVSGRPRSCTMIHFLSSYQLSRAGTHFRITNRFGIKRVWLLQLLGALLDSAHSYYKTNAMLTCKIRSAETAVSTRVIGPKSNTVEVAPTGCAGSKLVYLSNKTKMRDSSMYAIHFYYFQTPRPTAQKMSANCLKGTKGGEHPFFVAGEAIARIVALHAGIDLPKCLCDIEIVSSGFGHANATANYTSLL